MKTILPLLLIALSLTQCKNEKVAGAKNSRGQNETEQSIYRSGDSMLAAFHRKDWLTFVNYQHPGMVKMMGGHRAFASLVAAQYNQIPDTAVKKIELGKVLQVVTIPKDK